MIERVVENWLTSANERQYQIPFCQLLAAEGETIIYISPHGQMEQGKDVITLGPDHDVCAYQLKGGRLTLKDWRAYKGEIDELVIYPIEHPSIKNRKSHRPFLVTNGRVADTVLNSIRSANKAWSRQHGKPLTLIACDELVSRFVKAHGAFLPRDPKHFASFLELVVNSGRSPFEKSDFASFLESILPIQSEKQVPPREVQRAITSAVLLTTYVIQGCERAENHWGVFEAWTMMAAYIAAVAQKHSTVTKWWETSLRLCVLAATRALDRLTKECAENKTKFTQGNPFTDGHFYNARITILAGLLSAASLGYRLRGEKWQAEGFVHDFLLQYLPKIRVWGESAIPYLVLAALEIEQHGQHAVAEGLIFQLVRTIAEVNGSKGRGLPNPYYEPEAALRLTIGLDPFVAEVFAGHSYGLESLIQFLARRLDRRHLASVWEKITQVQFATFQVSSDWEYFQWRSQDGTLTTLSPTAPQSWKMLLAEAESTAKNISASFKVCPELPVYFALVYPHRFTTELLKTIETAVRIA